MTDNNEFKNNSFQDLTPNQKIDVIKLERKYESLKNQNTNFSEKLWRAFIDLCRAKGEIGLKELENKKKELIEDDFQKKVKHYDKVINQLYQDYYNKINILNNLKKTNNQQIEIINNSQYKILQQKNIQDKVLNESISKNRLSLFYNKQFRFNLRSVHNTVYLTVSIFTILIIIITINMESIKSNSPNLKDVLQDTLKDVIYNKQLSLVLIISILFLIIVFKSFNLVILLLIFYCIFVIFA